jgi:hypothetical protein
MRCSVDTAPLPSDVASRVPIDPNTESSSLPLPVPAFRAAESDWPKRWDSLSSVSSWRWRTAPSRRNPASSSTAMRASIRIKVHQGDELGGA